MGVATNRIWTDKQGVAQESTEFHNVVIWGKTAETVTAYLQKGSLVLVEGRLETRSWDDKSGAVRRVTEIIAESVQFGPRPIMSDAPAPHAVQKPKPPATSTDDDVPIISLDDDEVDTGRSLKPAFSDDEEVDDQEEIPF